MLEEAEKEIAQLRNALEHVIADLDSKGPSYLKDDPRGQMAYAAGAAKQVAEMALKGVWTARAKRVA